MADALISETMSRSAESLDYFLVLQTIATVRLHPVSRYKFRTRREPNLRPNGWNVRYCTARRASSQQRLTARILNL